MRLFRTDRRGNPISWRQRNTNNNKPTTNNSNHYQQQYASSSQSTSHSRTTPVTRNNNRLLFLVKNRSWPEVIRRCSTHPHEMYCTTDDAGNTILHVACRMDPPPDVISALSSLAMTSNTQGAIPLHVAASHQCRPASIKALLKSSSTGGIQQQSQQQQHSTNTGNNTSKQPPAAVLTRMGRAPIHYACMSFRGLSLEAFRILLDATIQSATSNNSNLDDDNDQARERKQEKEEEYSCLEPDNKDEDNDDDVDSIISSNSTCADTDDVTPRMNVLTLGDATGQTPLGLLFCRYRERVRCVIQKLDRFRKEHWASHRLSLRGVPPFAQRNSMAITTAMMIQANLGELWVKARWIVTQLAILQRREENVCDWIMRDVVESPGEQDIAQEAAKWALEQSATRVQVPSQEEGKSKRFRIVHASVSLAGYGCPPEMIRLAVSLHPEQVQERDEDGSLPIHIWAMAPPNPLRWLDHLCHQDAAASSENNNNNSNNNDDAATITSILTDWSWWSSGGGSMASGNSALLIHSKTTLPPSRQRPHDCVLKILLQQYPAAARVPHGSSGRLPLSLAMDVRTWHDGLQTLLEAYPPALESRKLLLSLYPLVFEKLGKMPPPRSKKCSRAVFRGKRNSNRGTTRAPSILTTIFTLIKAKPDLFKRE